MGCLHENTIFDYLNGALPPPQMEDATRHVETCAECCELIALLMRDRSALESTRRSQSGSSSRAEWRELLSEALPYGPGTVVGGRYRVVRVLGEGGMGTVCEVVHVKLGRSFALKRLSPNVTGSADALARFRREADFLATLRHPNIVGVFDWQELADGSPCLIMEHLQGEDLSRRLAKSGPLPWAAILRIGDAVLSALETVHEAGIVHRDLKPSNIFLAGDDAGSEHVKLLDFGLSTSSSVKGRLTAHDRLLGTPLYMSPEQAQGRAHEVGPSSDVWACGAILFEMAAGRRAFSGTTLPAILKQICDGEIGPLAEYRPDAPPELVRIVRAALSLGPNRIVSAAVLRRELRAALGPAPAPKKSRLALAAALGGSMALAGMVSWLLLKTPPPPRIIKIEPPPHTSVTTSVNTPVKVETTEVTISPSEARVTLDGQSVTGRVTIPRDGRLHLLRVSKDGFKSEQQLLDGKKPINIKLKRLRPQSTGLLDP